MIHIHIGRNQLYQQLLAPNKVSAACAKAAPVGSCGRPFLTKWLVLFGCTVNMSIVEGLCYNYLNVAGVVKRSVLGKGDESPLVVAALPTALLVGWFLLWAPISVFVTKTHGSRVVAVVGSILSAFALLLCSFLVQDIYGFALTYGVLAGKWLFLVLHNSS